MLFQIQYFKFLSILIHSQAAGLDELNNKY